MEKHEAVGFKFLHVSLESGRSNVLASLLRFVRDILRIVGSVRIPQDFNFWLAQYCTYCDRH